MRAFWGAASLTACLLLTACMSIKESTPMRQEVAERGLSVARGLPKSLPDGVIPVPGSQFVLIKADALSSTLLSLAVPIPFVTDMATNALNKREGSAYQGKYADVDPYVIALERLQGSFLLSAQDSPFKLIPLVYVVEGYDGINRFAQVFRVEGDGWTGRYMYHPTVTFTAEQLKAPSAADLQALRAELVKGAGILRGLMERDARGELKGDGSKVDFGSLFLVGGRGMGMVPATAYHYPGNELVEEGKDYVVVRARGDINGPANVGAMTFGVHYFYKDQLHTFKEASAKR